MELQEVDSKLKYEAIVSSVYDNDFKMFGKKCLYDGQEDTCWSSRQGLPQWISIKFAEKKHLAKLKMQFQGGFVGKECSLQPTDEEIEDQTPFMFYPHDNNSMQEIDVSPLNATSRTFKLTFRSSSDFYGRIVLYHLIVIGASAE